MRAVRISPTHLIFACRLVGLMRGGLLTGSDLSDNKLAAMRALLAN